MVDDFVLRTDCKEMHGQVMLLLGSLNDRLLKDNGTKSVQTQLRELAMATTHLTETLANHIMADQTALSRRLNIAMKSMIIIGLLYGLIIFIIRTAPAAIEAI